MNGGILPPNLFWREVASCYCDDLSLTLSSALTISAPVKLDFSTVLIVRKGLVRTAGQQVVLHYYLVPLVLLE